jgi:PAS domain-containing protein
MALLLPGILMLIISDNDEIGTIAVFAAQWTRQDVPPCPIAGRTSAKNREETMTGELVDSIAKWQQQTRPASLDSLLEGLGPLLPVLDLIPNAAIFIKDAQARYLLANRTLVERCGLKSLQPLLGKTSAEVFPSQLGPGYTAQDIKVLKDGLVLESQLELHLFNSREPGWCLTYKWPLYSAAGDIIGLIGISLDLQAASKTHPAYTRLVAVDEFIRSTSTVPSAWTS